MRNYNLDIAGYNIGFEATASGPDLIPSARFLRNIIPETNYDLLISVNSGTFTISEKAKQVFHAPFIEEVNGIQIRHRTDFWSIWKSGTDLFIHTILPLSSPEKNAVLKFSLETRNWDLWVDKADYGCDPFEYPLDGLILYYLTVIKGDIMIHASGINNSGTGYLFSGVSGKGKTTMAGLWHASGAQIIHDDRLIIRNTGNGYMMYSTPVYNNDEPQKSPVNKIFIIEHGIENSLVPVKEAAAVSLVMANCIQHNWGPEIISRLLGSVSSICEEIPVIKLSFRPDKNIIDHILENEQVPE
jgi:hypothetical protein